MLVWVVPLDDGNASLPIIQVRAHMFTDTLEIGTKDFSVEVPINLASNAEDIATLSKGNADYPISAFNRAHRINLQERSGAREFVRKAIAGKSASIINTPEFKAQLVSDLSQLLADWQPGARRAPVQAPPPSLTIESGKKTFTLAELQALAAKAGIKVETL